MIPGSLRRMRRIGFVITREAFSRHDSRKLEAGANRGRLLTQLVPSVVMIPGSLRRHDDDSTVGAVVILQSS